MVPVPVPRQSPESGAEHSLDGDDQSAKTGAIGRGWDGDVGEDGDLGKAKPSCHSSTDTPQDLVGITSGRPRRKERGGGAGPGDRK